MSVNGTAHRSGAGRQEGDWTGGVFADREHKQRARRITREDVMTAAEVAGLLSLPKSTVYELARRGELPCARLGRTIRFLRDDVEARLRRG